MSDTMLTVTFPFIPLRLIALKSPDELVRSGYIPEAPTVTVPDNWAKAVAHANSKQVKV
jgi:hypothetical protein